MKFLFSVILVLMSGSKILAQDVIQSAHDQMPAKLVETKILNALVEKEINIERKKHGLKPLIHVDYFENYAVEHSSVMSRTKKVEHSTTEDDDRIKGECIYMKAKTSFDDMTYGECAKDIVHGWMTSKSHREIILTEDLTEFGVGIAEGSYNYSGFTMNALYATLVVN